jgi:SulP family sulfate permease
MKLFSNLKGDLMGGIATSVIALPWAIAFGIVAFAPLGKEYVAQGALAGIYGVIVASFLACLFGGTPGQISLPTAAVSVMISTIIVNLLKTPEIAALGANQVPVILILISITVLFASLLQGILGLLGGGKFIKFIPYPVIAGIMNGIAIIVFLGQLRPLLGVPNQTGLMDILTFNAPIQFETLIVGVVTMLVLIFAKRITRAIPSSLIALLCGIFVYVLLGKLVNPDLLKLEGNPLILGAIPSGIPTPKQIANFFNVQEFITLKLISKLLIPALTLGILSSIDTLLDCVVTDMQTHGKHNSRKELLAQGIGNTAAAIFGSLPVAAQTLATAVNLRSGGKTALAGMISSTMVFLVVMFMGGLVQWIPMSVLAAILLVTAYNMIEFESISLSMKKSAIGNLLVIAAVTFISVAIDAILAVMVGLIITAFLFIKEQISKSVVRRTYSGNLVHSKKVRSKEGMQILEKKGESIKIYELNGSLFFGTCDKLQNELEKDLDAFCIILDFKRVHTIDLTGSQLLKQIVDRVHEKENYLLFAHLDGDPEKQRLKKLMNDAGVIKAIGKEFIFSDLDHAQEWAEDALIQREVEAAHLIKQKLALKNLSIFQNLTDEQLEIVQRYLHPVSYKPADIVFKEGDPGDKIYFILAGGVSVLASISENGRDRRLATFGEGVFFGDMAILEGQPRSATVRADSDTELVYMTVDDFNHLVNHEPLIASKMLLGMARELSYRLRLTTIEVRTLAE